MFFRMTVMREKTVFQAFASIYAMLLYEDDQDNQYYEKNKYDSSNNPKGNYTKDDKKKRLKSTYWWKSFQGYRTPKHIPGYLYILPRLEQVCRQLNG